MKILQLAIIVLAFSVLILSNWSQAEGRIVPQTVLQLYKESDMILVGNVIFVETTSSDIYTLYHIKVEQYLKSPLQNDTITVKGLGPDGGRPPPDPKFTVGDRVRLYLYNENGTYMISMYSTIANPKCYAHELLGLGPHEPIPRGGYDQNYSIINCGPPFQFTSYPHTTFLPPEIQLKSGMQAENIACNDGLQLIFKTEDGTPACVTTSTAQKLINRGWTKTATTKTFGTIPAVFDNGVDSGYSVNYTITGGKITEAKINLLTQSLILSTSMVNDGNLTLNLPKGLLDFKHDYWTNGIITPYVDGKKMDYQYQKSDGYWILTMELKNGVTKVEVIPTINGTIVEQK